MGFITQFVIIINWISFPYKGDDSSIVSIKSHTVSSTPTATGISVSLWKCTVSYRAYGRKNFDIISK